MGSKAERMVWVDLEVKCTIFVHCVLRFICYFVVGFLQSSIQHMDLDDRWVIFTQPCTCVYWLHIPVFPTH